MQNILNLSLLLLILIISIESKNNLLGKRNISIKAEEYKRFAAIYIKSNMFKEDIFMVDTRENTVSNKGYLKIH